MDALNWAVVANGKGSNGNQIVAINRIVSHPFATKVRGFHQNDIALIELTHNLEFDELVQPICLGDKVPEQGDMCIIAGVIKKGEGKRIYFYFLSKGQLISERNLVASNLPKSEPFIDRFPPYPLKWVKSKNNSTLLS